MNGPIIDNEWDQAANTTSGRRAALVISLLFFAGLCCALVIAVSGA